jgi:transcriptional regulator with XRE-family HTH domain
MPRQTLANLIQNARSQRGWDVMTLAERSNISRALIEQVEEGRLNFLSQTQRSRLANVLKLHISDIKAVEIEPPIYQLGDVELEYVTTDLMACFNNGKRLPLHEMERNPEGFWPCPDCGAGLHTVTRTREDLKHNVLLAFTIRCTECLFTLKHEHNLSEETL